MHFCFDELGGWFLRNSKGQFSSPIFESFDDLLEFWFSKVKN